VGVLVEPSKGAAIYIERLMHDGKFTDETISTCAPVGD
jgi:hypothetical protein